MLTLLTAAQEKSSQPNKPEAQAPHSRSRSVRAWHAPQQVASVEEAPEKLSRLLFTGAVSLRHARMSLMAARWGQSGDDYLKPDSISGTNISIILPLSPMLCGGSVSWAPALAPPCGPEQAGGGGEGKPVYNRDDHAQRGLISSPKTWTHSVSLSSAGNCQK